jgi:phosphate transport system permease protein
MAIAQSSLRKTKGRKFKSKMMMTLCGVASAVAVIPLVFVIGYILLQGLPALHWKTLTDLPRADGGGLKVAILGSLELLGIASCFGLPLGVLGGIYMVEFGGKFAATVRFLTDVLNSVPSIIIGMFVYVVVVMPIAQMNPGHGFSALAGGFALGIIMIPTVMRTTEEILRLVPSGLRDASLALGAPRWKAMFGIILPAARGGVITGIMLALARIAGETAPLLFTAFGNQQLNFRIDRPVDALPLSIFMNANDPSEFKHHLAQAGALILVALITGMSLTARRFTRSKFSVDGK